MLRRSPGWRLSVRGAENVVQVLAAAGAYVAQRVWEWGLGLGRWAALGLVLAATLVGFLVVVGLDSGQNRAAAADLAPMQTAQTLRVQADRRAPNPDPMARRLHHGTTTARMTGNHLTRAHFFTDAASF